MLSSILDRAPTRQHEVQARSSVSSAHVTTEPCCWRASHLSAAAHLRVGGAAACSILFLEKPEKTIVALRAFVATRDHFSRRIHVFNINRVFGCSFFGPSGLGLFGVSVQSPATEKIEWNTEPLEIPAGLYDTIRYGQIRSNKSELSQKAARKRRN